MLVLCPGLHHQQKAPELNRGEFPACAAMTSGYCFRVENPATVLFLQKVGRTACLTTIQVSRPNENIWQRKLDFLCGFGSPNRLSTLAHGLAAAVTLIAISLVVSLHDWWALTVIVVLMLARLMNVLVIRSRAEIGW